MQKFYSYSWTTVTPWNASDDVSTSDDEKFLGSPYIPQPGNGKPHILIQPEQRHSPWDNTY